MAPISPTVANWALGLRLREKREGMGLSGMAAAKRIGITGAYLSEVEKGKKNLAPDRLGTLVDVYAIPADEAEELRTLRDQAAQRGWWAKYSGMFSDELIRFFGLEYGAETIHGYDGNLIWGLFQTRDYARAIIESGRAILRMAEVDRRVECRLHRQRRIEGDDPLRVNFVMGEAAIHQQVGGPEVLKDQLEHLLTVIDEHADNVEIRIVPFSCTGHEAMGASCFQLLSFPNMQLPAVLYQESVTATSLTTNQITVREYSIGHSAALDSALSREDSRDLIKKVLSRL